MSASATPYINFKLLRKGLSFEAVLKHYNVEVKKKAQVNRHVGPCPLPHHQGKKHTPSFSAKLDWGVWQCFSCKASGAKHSSGNTLDFAVLMEGLDPENPQDLRKVALKLQDIFKVPGADIPPSSGPAISKKSDQPPATSTPPPKTSTSNLPVLINPPLDFELKNLDFEHPYLRQRGFTPETIQHFGLGFCNRGLMTGRCVIPLHDSEGRLIGYAGRIVDDAAISKTNPKYLLPGPRERKGTQIEFHASKVLYNFHRLECPVDELIVVEGFASVWWLTQHGYDNVVAVMGSSCSEEQAMMIISALAPFGRVWILTDGDAGGVDCAKSIFTHVAPRRWVKWVKLLQGQPTDYTPGDFERMFV